MNYEGALEDYIWFHNNALQYDPALYGVRLSFALSDWVELGKKYPKAMRTLLDIRDTKTKQIKEGLGTFELFHDVMSINVFLDKTEDTIDLYTYMTDNDFFLAKKCYRLIRKELIDRGRFQLCNRFINYPLLLAQRMKDELETHTKIYKKMEVVDEDYMTWAVNQYLKEAEHTALVLIKNNRFDEVEKFFKEVSEDIEYKVIINGLKEVETRLLQDGPLDTQN